MTHFNITRRLSTVPSSLPALISHSPLPRYRYRSLCLFGDALQDRRSISASTRYASSASTESLPRVAQPSLWHSVVPKFLRSKPPMAASTAKSPASKEWNPATFFIVVFLLIGSQAIQIISVRNELRTYNRKADAKISLLKEVIERVQKGENVDVQGLLGTGDKAKEKEWEEVLREIEEEDALWQKKSRKKKENTVAEDPERDIMLDSSDTVYTSRLGGDALPKKTGQRLRRSTDPSHGFY